MPPLQIINSVVAEACVAVGCRRRPRVVVKRMRNACYNPLFHRIAVSDQLASSLEPAVLRILLAHEVAHAAQRRWILRDILRCLVPPVAALLGAGTAAALLLSAQQPVTQPLLALLAGVGLAAYLESVGTKTWGIGYLARELAADAFAAKFAGCHDATKRMLEACSAIEDDGLLSDEALARIAALKLDC